MTEITFGRCEIAVLFKISHAKALWSDLASDDARSVATIWFGRGCISNKLRNSL